MRAHIILFAALATAFHSGAARADWHSAGVVAIGAVGGGGLFGMVSTEDTSSKPVTGGTAGVSFRVGARVGPHVTLLADTELTAGQWSGHSYQSSQGYFTDMYTGGIAFEAFVAEFRWLDIPVWGQVGLGAGLSIAKYQDTPDSQPAKSAKLDLAPCVGPLAGLGVDLLRKRSLYVEAKLIAPLPFGVLGFVGVGWRWH